RRRLVVSERRERLASDLERLIHHGRRDPAHADGELDEAAMARADAAIVLEPEHQLLPGRDGAQLDDLLAQIGVGVAHAMSLRSLSISATTFRTSSISCGNRSVPRRICSSRSSIPALACSCAWPSWLSAFASTP